MTDFTALGLSEPLLRALEKNEFTTPTEIQADAIPALMDGHDLIGLAATGTGKTAAFLLPMLHKLIEDPKAREPGKPRVLILSPTRELAQQIGQALNLFSGYIHLRSTVVYGGSPMSKQLNKLRAGVDILVATPGRLMDHVNRGSVAFDATDTFILDEADRMLDMGFIGDVKTISSSLPTPHQTVMFSATTNKAIDKLSLSLLNDPVRISTVKKVSVADTVTHKVLHVSGENKKDLLQEILAGEITGQTIIFTKTKWGADKLSRELARKGHSTDAIHGDRNQRQRQRTLTRFRDGDVQILIATDVAARGIDVPGIDRVINFDLPLEPESYVHRVGRTGRNDAKGEALSLCTPEDLVLLYDIEHLLKMKITVDADHDFHQDPPARPPTGKPSKKARKKARARSGQGGGWRSGGGSRQGRRDNEGSERNGAGNANADAAQRRLRRAGKIDQDGSQDRQGGERGDRGERGFGEKRFGDKKPGGRKPQGRRFNDGEARDGDQRRGDRRPRNDRQDRNGDERDHGARRFNGKKPNGRKFGGCHDDGERGDDRRDNRRDDRRGERRDSHRGNGEGFGARKKQGGKSFGKKPVHRDGDRDFGQDKRPGGDKPFKAKGAKPKPKGAKPGPKSGAKKRRSNAKRRAA